MLLQTEFFQNFLIRKVTSRLSADLHTEVSIRHVSLTFFNRMDLNGILIRDLKKDTLLYAGSLKVRITDWFFFKDHADLKFAGLEDAVIRLNRSDSTWNYQFLSDYFTSGKPPPQKKGKPFRLDIKKLDFKNVRIVQDDRWTGNLLSANLGSLVLNADQVDLDRNIFRIHDLSIDAPDVLIESFPGLKKEQELRAPEPDTGLYFNPGRLLLEAREVNITHGSFTLGSRGEKTTPGVFDGSRIVTKDLNVKLRNGSFVRDTIRADIDLSTNERSGLQVKKLKARFRLTPAIMEFAGLDLVINRSRLRDYFAMHFRDFNRDMADFIARIRMSANFRESSVSSADIAFFAPDLRTWKKQFQIAGQFDGTVADFHVKKLFLRTSPITYLSGDFAMKGLPDIDRTHISFSNGLIQTNRNELSFLVPDLLTIDDPDLAALGTIRYQGGFEGSIHDFRATGTASTALGGLTTNLSMKLPVHGEPSYSGNLVTRQFDLGKLIHVSSIGRVSFSGKIAGTSFALDKTTTTLDGRFDHFAFNGYDYAAITFNGSIQKKNFNGELKIDDPNFNFTSTIQIDLNDSIPRFNVLGDLANSNLQEINLTPKKFELAGLFDLNFKGRDIDDFLGTAKILNATLKQDTTRLSFDSLSISASVDTSGRKILSARSNQFDVLLRGQYNILDLPNSFQLFLNKYFPSYINAPAEAPKNQRFSVTLRTRDFEKYAQILDPRLSGFNNAILTGGVNTRDSGVFFLRLNVPYGGYDRYRFSNASLQGRGDSVALNLTGDIGRINLSDSLFFPNTHIRIRSQADHSVVNISTSANSALNDAKLNADVFTLPDGVRINFQPSSFVVNDKKWNLEKEGELVIRKDFASARNVRFTQGFQELNIETVQEMESSSSDLVARLKNVNIGDFMPLITREPRLEGVADGNIYMRDFFGRFRLEADLKTRQFRLNNDSVGVVNVQGQFNSETGQVTFGVQSNNEKYNLNAKGGFDTRDTTGKPLTVDMDLRGARIAIVNMFLDNIFSDIDGQAYGNLQMKGDPSAPDLLGKVTLRNGGLKVNYTQVRYRIDSAVFNFQDGLIDFGQFQVRDIRNNTATVRGKLYEKGFKNLRYDFEMSTPKLLLIDTKPRDNPQFYGRAIGRASLSFRGPQDNMRLSITGSVNDTTHIAIVTATGRESADADFIVFKQYGTEIRAERKLTDTRLSVDLDLTANNQASIDVVLDPLTGDVIRASGNGHLQIAIPATGAMTMKGRYNIERGSYEFNSQSFIRKPFFIEDGEGANYIEWTGDPFNAQINVDVRYTAERVSLNDLVANQSVEGYIRAYKGDVYVIAELRGLLTKPDINFRIDFPPGSVIKNNADLIMLLNRIQSDKSEVLKQVAWLVALNSFAPYGVTSNGANINLGSFGLNSISQQLTNEINRRLSNVLYKITGDKSLRFDLGASTYSSASLFGNATGTNRLDRQNISLKASQSIADGKVIIQFGSDLDFNLASAQAVQAGNFQWLPDLSVEFVLTRDRKLRAVVFAKSSLDVATAGSTTGIGRRNRQGVSISYTHDFEKLFGDKQKEPKTTSTNP